MRRFFVKNLLFVITVNLLVKPVWFFVIDRTVQNRVGNEDYGVYLALFNLSVIFQILLDFGLTNYNSRAIAREPDKLSEIFPSMFTARIALAMLYGVVTCIMGVVMGFESREMMMLLGVLVFQALNYLLQFFRSNVAGLHRFKADGVLSILDRFLMIIICGLLLVLPATGEHFKIEWFIYLQIFSYGLAAFIAFIALQKISKISLRFSLNIPGMLKIMKESFPYAALIFLMSIYTRVDTIMMKRMLGAEGDTQNGIYAHSYRLLDVGNMFGLMFASMLLPMFGRMLLQKVNIQPIIQLCVNILLPFSVMCAVGASFYGYPLIHALYTHATPYDGTIFAWLMASFPAFCMMYVYSTLLTANGSIKLLINIAIAGVVLNMGLNYFLIPDYKAVGAAVSTVVTQTTLSIGYIIFSGKTFKLPLNIKWIIAHLAFLAFSIGLAYSFDMLGLEWYNKLLLFGAAEVLLMFPFGFVSIRSIRQLMDRS